MGTPQMSEQQKLHGGKILKDIAIKVVEGNFPAAELTAERLKVCESCDKFRRLSRQCSLCNCFMDLKTRFVASECPIGYW